ncbi:WD40 repeat domain-containing serine/threonine protein kinase [Candidatus Uabimicrobium amorphum]|uniref:non-specific serine/threonine protein kinase n=1 Tax=Uabimicrobium amorphum TaxID=2596890 RepID=A0A5S9IIR2_UABAM|nr:WD40 repeat domain-containing serine/threonine protein kinase [Candidatus Uabimicrobium amorphum]BBM82553.1 protein kinase [Candidatus Uabimicrobium amorphum]
MKKEMFITYILETLGWINEATTQQFAKTNFVSVYGYLNTQQQQKDQLNFHYWYIEFLLLTKLEETEVVDNAKCALWFYDNLHRVAAKKPYISLIRCDVLSVTLAKSLASQMLKEGIFDIDSMKIFLQAIQIPSEPSEGIDIERAYQYLQKFSKKVDAYRNTQGELTRVGHYKVLSELGRGGMGIVFKALDTKLNRFVALKVITNQRVSELNVRRFIQETKAVAALQHPNIIQIFDAGQEPKMYFAMEYVNGQSMRDKLSELQGKYQDCAIIMQKLCSALQYVHEKRIIHRDIKPDNIMLDEAGEPKLMDFGLAKMIDENNSLSRQGDVVGTPFYMSPEQTQGQKVDSRSDIYSLGASFYQMLTGRTVFQGNMYIQIVYKICNDDPIAPRMLDSDIPKDLELICLKCLEKSKERRYQTAQDLKQDIENYLQHKPISVKVNILHNMRKWCYRHKFLTASIFLAAILMAVIGWFSIEKSRTNQRLTKLIGQLETNNIEKEHALAQLEKNNVEKAHALAKSQKQLVTAHIKMAEYQFLQRKMSRAKDELFAAKEISEKIELPAQQKAYVDLLLEYSVAPTIPIVKRSTPLEAKSISYVHKAYVDENYISLSSNQRIFVWKRGSKTLKEEEAIVTKGVHYTICGDYLVCTWQTDIKIMHLKTMKEKTYAFPEVRNIHHLAFSPRTKWIAIKAYERLILFHIVTRKKIEIDTKHRISDSNPIYFDKSGTLLIGGIESSIATWELKKDAWSITSSVSFLGRQVHANRLSPDRKLLFYGDDQGELTILQLAGKMSSSVNYHKTKIVDITFNQSGRLFATAEKEGKVILWDQVSVKPIVMYDTGLLISHVHFVGKQSIGVIGFREGKFTYEEFLVEKNLDGDYAVHKKKDLIAVLNKLAIKSSAFRNLLHLSPKGKYIAVSYNTVVFLWDRSQKFEKFFVVDNNFLYGEVRELDFSPDEKKMSLFYTDGRIVVLETATMKVIADIKPTTYRRGMHEGFAIFSTDSSHLLFTQRQKNDAYKIYSYHLKNHTKKYIQKAKYIITKRLIVGDQLVVGTMMGKVEIYTISATSIRKHLDFSTKINERVQAIAWTPKRLALYIRDTNAIQVYTKKQNTYAFEKSIPVYGKVNFLSFSPRGNKLAIFQFDRIYLYDVDYDAKVEILAGYFKGGAAVVLPSWEFLAVPSHYGNVITMKMKR